MTAHVVRTTHIQRLIQNAMSLAALVDDLPASERAEAGGSHRVDGWATSLRPEHILGKAAADLRHAAEELEAERLSCLGWTQS